VQQRLPVQYSARLDAEDVVQSVYWSFFADARAGRFELHRGGDLWRVLVAIVLHKLDHQLRRNRAGKRAIHRERGFGNEDSLFGIQPQVLAQYPSPLEAAALADEVEQLLRRLKPLQRRVLELRLQGYTIEEIAADTQRSERRVYCILEEIKEGLSL
jgi:RNA polymerase sigma factor (sigma-70 family)